MTERNRRKFKNNAKNQYVSHEYKNHYIQQFTKKFPFVTRKERNVKYVEEKITNMFHEDKWKICEFQELKDELNTVKSKLNNLNLNEWHQHTSSTHIGQYVLGTIKRTISPELLTQAWCKFSEIAATYNLIPMEALEKRYFNSVHLCEAPGAFVTSLNHYMRTNLPHIQWRWLASSLSPYYEGNTVGELINDDRFMLHTLPNWIFGDDLTGDLMNLSNMLSIVAKAKEILSNDIMLVTADGSVDCQVNPAEQEVNVAALKYCETVTALHLLQTGGSFVIKLFTFFECETLCLLNLLCTAFKTIQFFKPITSKGGNSEVYLICMGYIGRKVMEPWLKVLRNNYGRNITKKALFPRSHLSAEFISEVYNCASYFMKHQIMVIQFNIKTFHTFTQSDRCMVDETCEQIADEFVPFYKLKYIHDFEMLVGNHILRSTPIASTCAKLHVGTFNDIVRKKKMGHLENLRYILEKIKNMVNLKSEFKECQFQIKDNCDPQLDIQQGRPITVLKYSRFCLQQLVVLYLEVNALVTRDLLYNDPPELSSEVKLCNVSDYPWSTNVYEAQKQSVYDITTTMAGLQDNDTVCIVGLSLLTQFTVGLVYLLAHSFEHIKFVLPTTLSPALLFVKFNKNSSLHWLSDLKDHLEKQTDGGSVHSFVSAKHLIYDDIAFYEAVCNLNCSLLRSRTLHAISEELGLA